MKIDTQQVLAFASTHPVVVTTALSVLSSALSDPAVYTDALGLIGGEIKPIAFAKAHPDLIAKLATIAVKDLGPTGVLQILGALGKD